MGLYQLVATLPCGNDWSILSFLLEYRENTPPSTFRLHICQQMSHQMLSLYREYVHHSYFGEEVALKLQTGR